MKKMIHLITMLAVAILGASGLSRNSVTSASSAPTAPTGAANTQHATTGEIPAAVKEAVKESFPKAQITPQHKDLTDAQIAGIEKESGMKPGAKDHDSYLLHADEGGARKQVGVATVVKAQGREVVVIYKTEKGELVIAEAHGEAAGIPDGFFEQFKGKCHDDELSLGQNIKPQGLDEALARAITAAIRLDVVTMHELYDKAHKH